VRYGWGKKGEPLVEAVPAKRGKNRLVLGALDQEEMPATTSKLGAMTRADVEWFLRVDLLPRLLAGSVLVLNNASIHKGARSRLCWQRRSVACCTYLPPPYSLDLNPIELAWSWVKARVRRRCPRDPAARRAAIDEAVSALPSAFAPHRFTSCGLSVYCNAKPLCYNQCLLDNLDPLLDSFRSLSRIFRC
jgi:transposase